MIRLGIIGCGHWGSNHIRIFNMPGRVKIKVCCDKDQARLKAINSTYPDLSITADYNKVLADKNIDAVIIATPTATHYSLVKSALLCGKHVLCEKPLTIKNRESEELTFLAKRKKKILMVGYVFLFNTGIISLKNLIEKKELGKIYYLNFTRTNLGPIRDDVDVIYDLASHDISIASFLLNSWPKSVCANAGYFLRRNISDIAFITLEYPLNILVNIHVSWLDPRKIRRITCVGDKKMATWDDLNTAEPVKLFNKTVTKEPFYSDYGEFQLLPREGEVIIPFIKLSEPLKNQNVHFIECLENVTEPLTNASVALNITKVLEAIHISIKKKGQVLKIK